MSTTVYKTCLRARIPNVKSDKEHRELFQSVLGDPVEKDDWYFSYHDKDNSEPYFSPVGWEGDYGVELIFVLERDSQEEVVCLSLGEIQEHASRMAEKFGEDQDSIKLCSYSWYNGVDEPIEW